LKKYKYVCTFLLLQTLITIVFFAIPRYQTMMKIVLVPFAAYAVVMIIDYSKLRLTEKNKKR